MATLAPTNRVIVGICRAAMDAQRQEMVARAERADSAAEAG